MKINMLNLLTMCKWVITFTSSETNNKTTTSMKTLLILAQSVNSTVVPITYRAQGVNLSRKGYDIIDSDNNILLSMEPISRRFGAIVESGWMWKNHCSGKIGYVRRLNQMADQVISAGHTGWKFQ